MFLGQDMAGRLGEGNTVMEAGCAGTCAAAPAREKKKRGYNQAALLAAELGKQLDIPVLTGFVERTRNTRPQKELEGAKRQNNLKESF